MHKAFETRFAQNLLTPPLPKMPKRFAVYRNNVFVSLIEALKARFPAVQNAVGVEFFEALARDYAGSNLPTSPLMMHYGDNFPDFIDVFHPLGDYPWIGDLARVECALTQSYHAADATPFNPEVLAAFTPGDLYHLTFRLHPASRMVQSAFPVVTIWQMNSGHREVTPIDDLSSETALIHRPRFNVSVKAISAAGNTFLNALQSGKNLGEANLSASIDGTFDLTTHLHLLIADGLATDVFLPPTNRNPL